MKKTIILITIFFVTAFGVCFFLSHSIKNDILFTAVIALGTICYHFFMRLSVGFIVDKTMNNKADYTKSWYQSKTWEKKLYKKLHVKHWKGSMPTYDNDIFNYKKHSWNEIVQASCQAEIVHEVIIVFSFVPVIFSVWFGETIIFVVTSILAALLDLSFVIIQRYNRPRIIRLIER